MGRDRQTHRLEVDLSVVVLIVPYLISAPESRASDNSIADIYETEMEEKEKEKKMFYFQLGLHSLACTGYLLQQTEVAIREMR
jgi:hypothetical protein